MNPAAPLRALFIADGDVAGGAAAAALGADPGIALMARATDLATGINLAAAHRPDVVVYYTRRGAPAGQAELERALAPQQTPLVVVDAAAPDSFATLRERIRAAHAPARAGARVAGPAPKPTRLIAIGSSTGGVEALVEVLARFPASAPPTVIVQHMPALFTSSFAQRLDGLCAARVEEAWDGAPLETGRVYLAPGGPAHLEVQWSPTRKVRLVACDPVNRHRPSVDVAFGSIVRAGVQGVVAVLLTGMGRDGAEGLLALRHAGARTIAQDRESSTVYGMPRAALENGAVDHGTPLNRIADAIFSPETLQKEAI